jgi:hypothetical protein
MLGGPRVREALLRAKAFSLLAMFPACPILSSYANYLLRCLGEGRMLYSGQGGHMNYWEHCEVGVVRHEDIQSKSRLLMAELYGVSTSTQLELESYFDGLTKLQDLDHPSLNSLYRSEWCTYAQNYVWRYEPEDPDIFFL